MLACALLSGHAHAEVDQVVKDARAMLDKGQAQQAFDLLAPLEAPRAGDPDFDTVFGISAIETAQFTRAIFALERVLLVQPENSRARAELGRALFAVGDTQGSRKVLLETKQGNIPPEAAATIDQFLQAIDRSEDAARSSLKGYVEYSVGGDSNINSGPGNANVAVPAFGGLIFTLNNAGLKKADYFASLSGGLNGRYVVDSRWSLIGNAYVSGRTNINYNGFDTLQGDVNAGATYRYEKHEFSAVVQAGTYDVDHDRVRDQYGVVGEWTYRLDGYRQFSSYIQLGELKYPGQSLRDADRTVIGGSYAHALRNGLLVYGGAYIGTEKEKNSGVPFLGHKLFGLRGGVQKELSPDVALFGSLAYEDRKFNGQDLLFQTTRHDQQLNLNLGVNWVPAKFWRVTPQLALTNVKSNIPLSDFSRSLFSITVRRDF
jgi:hypothetical protein